MPRFARNLNYTHERLYRTISGVIVGDESFRARLDSAQMMLAPLSPSDFPRELRDAFTEIIDTPARALPEDAASGAIHKLIQLLLDVSEHVVNGAAFGDQYEQSAWCVMEAQEGRPEPLRLLMNNHRKRHQPLPANVVAFRTQQSKGLVKVRRGPKSLYPARVIEIARMVRDRLEFQKIHNPKASLNKAAQHVAAFIGRGKGTPKAAYLSVYHA